MDERVHPLVRRADELTERALASPLVDTVADKLQPFVRRTLASGRSGEILGGQWLGHAAHPMLTDLPIGFWTSSLVADLLGPRAARAADALLALGIASAAPTVAAGLVDWSKTEDEARRIGVVHAACNAAATATYVASLAYRLKHKRVRGVAAGLLAAGIATAGGYLGGKLVFEEDAAPEDLAQPETGPAEAPQVVALTA